MKHIAIVSPQFAPSNLTSAHRARLLASHLPEFGWKPTIITVHEKYYEEKSNPELLNLLPSHLDIRRAWAFPVKPVRFVGDIGIRGFWGMYQQIVRLHQEHKIDFLYITIPSNYAALLGPIICRRYAIPYGIDYQDPWVHNWPDAEKKFSKAWFSSHLARVLEPIAIAKTSLITSVAESYYDGVLKREPHLKDRAVMVAMPIGIGEVDLESIKKISKKPFLFSEDAGKIIMIYAGAMLPKAYGTLAILLRAIRFLISNQPEIMDRFRLYFVGTGKSADDTQGYNVLPYIKQYQLEKWIVEYPQRIQYQDVLNHLQHASSILILGSIEQHYTPSKVFQSLAAKRPLFAILHEGSTAVSIIRESNTGLVITLRETKTPEPEEVAKKLLEFLQNHSKYSQASDDVLGQYSSRQSAKTLAEALEKVIAKRIVKGRL